MLDFISGMIIIDLTYRHLVYRLKSPRVLKSRTLFFTTSPRTPEKMIPEIRVLRIYEGEMWTGDVQTHFIEKLTEYEDFQGTASNDPAFSARDRINRGPKSLGFVDLDPVITVTEPGNLYTSEESIDTEETLLRQLLKFQIPSPYHIPHPELGADYWVKPYLEIIRLIQTLGKLSFDELCIFGLQLVNYHDFDKIVEKIQCYREKIKSAPNKKIVFKQTFEDEVRGIYSYEIENKKYKTRESSEESEDHFIKTKIGNMRDYADSCVRYLRSAGVISISRGIHSSISIMESRKKDIEYILATVGRDPVFVDNYDKYREMLFDPNCPKLYTDDKNNLIEYLLRIGDKTKNELLKLSEVELTALKIKTIESNRRAILDEELGKLRTYHYYQDIIDTYDNIRDDFDPSLTLEWNTWRAMAMLDDGQIVGNFKLDDEGLPMSTAPGKMPDIECLYDNFGLIVEVTMSGGVKQYEMEGESVPRHLGQFKKKVGKESYGLFVAPSISESTIDHFYVLYRTNIPHYGGKAVIVPITLVTFRTMIENAYASKVNGHTPTADDVESIFKKSRELALAADSPDEWYSSLNEYIKKWLKL